MAHPMHPNDMPSADAIPMFNKMGTALTEDDRAKLAHKRGQCVQCGIKTADVKGIFKRVSLTNAHVYNGICIRCNRDKVPPEIAAAWEAKHQPAPTISPMKTKLRAAVRGAVFANQMHHDSAQQLDGQHGSGGVASFRASPGGGASSSIRDPQFDGHMSLSSLRTTAEPPRGRLAQSAPGMQYDGHSGLSNLGRQTSMHSSRSSSRGSSSGARAHNFDGHHSFSSFRDSIQEGDSFDEHSSTSNIHELRRPSDRPGGSERSGERLRQLVEDISITEYERKTSLPPDVPRDAGSTVRQKSSREIAVESHAGEQTTDTVFQVLEAIKENRNNPEVLKQKLYQLRNLGDDKADSLFELKDIMSDYRDDPKVLSAAAGALWSVTAEHDEKKMEAAECGAIDCILDALRNNVTRSDPEFVEWAIGSLACLARGKLNRDMIGNSNGMETILDTLKLHQTSAGVFEWSCRALHSLVHQYEDEADEEDAVWKNMTSIDEHDGILTIVGAMKMHYSETVAEGWAVQLLLRLLDRDTSAAINRVLNQINAENGIAACVKVLKARSTTPEVFSLTAELMANLIVQAEERGNTNAIETAIECLPTMVRVMKEFAHVEELQESSCRLISYLANGENRQQIKESRVLGIVVTALGLYSTNLPLQVAGSWICWSMSFLPDLFDPTYVTNTLEALDVSTRNFPDASLLLTAICGFIGNLYSTVETNTPDIAMDMLLRAIRMDDPVDMVDEQAFRALTSICIRTPSIVSQIAQEGIIESIMNRLRPGHSKACAAACKVLIAMADTDDTNKKSIIEAGCHDRALALLRASSSSSDGIEALDLMSASLAWEKRQKVSLQNDSVSIILEQMQTHCSSNTLLVSACGTLTNLLLATSTGSTRLNLDGLVESMTGLITVQKNSVEVKQEACKVLWAFAAKQRTHSVAELSSMFRTVASAMRTYKGEEEPFNPDFQSSASGALGAITARMQDTSVQISTQDVDSVIAVIYMAMEHERDRIELLETLLTVILNLSSVSQAEVIQCGGIVVVIDAMAEHEKAESIQEKGCSILALLASSEDLQVNLCIAETDGVDMIISALASFPSNEGIQVNACKALSYLTVDRESRMMIASQGGVMLVVNAMKNNRENLGLLEDGCSALLNLSSDADEQVLALSGVVENMIDIMRYQVDNSKIQENGLGVLQNMSMRNSELKRKIAQLGGIEVVTTSMKEFMGLASVLERAFTTLWSLAVLDSNQVAIANAGGIELVVNGMMAHINSDMVQKQACGCLRILAANSRNNELIREAGGIDAIVYAMWVQYESEVVLSEACRALSSVVVDVHTNEAVIASDGEINAILSAMRCFPDSMKLQENACVALRNLLLSPESVESVRACIGDISVMVAAAANRFPEQCGDCANQVLASLS